MANGKFIVCNHGIPGPGQEHANCADCLTSIVIDGPRDASSTYICQGCLPKRLERDDDIDEVQVDVDAGATKADDRPVSKLSYDETAALMAACTESRTGDCGCRWCQHLNPICADLAAVFKAHPEADKLTRVMALVRMLGEAAVAANPAFGMHHRDASFTAGLVARELHVVADREHVAAVEKLRPMFEQALRDAGIDVDEILRANLPKEQTH